MEGSTTLHCLAANQSMLESRQEPIEVEQAVLQQQEPEGDHRHGHHQAVGQDGTQLVQPVGEGRHDSHTTQLRRTRSVPKYFILKVIQ